MRVSSRVVCRSTLPETRSSRAVSRAIGWHRAPTAPRRRSGPGSRPASPTSSSASAEAPLRPDDADEHRPGRLALLLGRARPRRSCSAPYVAPVRARTPRAIASAHSAETTPCGSTRSSGTPRTATLSRGRVGDDATDVGRRRPRRLGEQHAEPAAGQRLGGGHGLLPSRGAVPAWSRRAADGDHVTALTVIASVTVTCGLPGGRCRPGSGGHRCSCRSWSKTAAT